MAMASSGSVALCSIYHHHGISLAGDKELSLLVAGPGLLAAEDGQAGRLVRSCYLQLEADSADETLLNQALKCIVFLALPLYDHDAARDLIPAEEPNQPLRRCCCGC